MTTTEYQVTGMTCAHCEGAIRSEVAQIDGVGGSEVRAAPGRLAVTTTAAGAAHDAAVLAAVEEAGYEARVA